MLGYIFLAAGAVEPLSRFVWPTPRGSEPGAWVDAGVAPRDAMRGCTVGNLLYWLDDELWTIELDGPLTEGDHVVHAERARLVGRIETWTEPVARALVAECAHRVADEAAAALRRDGHAAAATRLERAQDLAELERAAISAAGHRPPAGRLAGHVADICFYARDAGVAAHAAGIATKMSAYALAGEGSDAGEHDERLAKERAWQAAWLVDRLGL